MQRQRGALPTLPLQQFTPPGAAEPACGVSLKEAVKRALNDPEKFAHFDQMPRKVSEIDRNAHCMLLWGHACNENSNVRWVCGLLPARVLFLYC